MTEHVIKAIQQLRLGETIGRRGTPVISFWPMRPKWERFGDDPWQVIGTDGEAEMRNGGLVVPAVLQLIYFKCHDGRVCQLAYVLEPEFTGMPGTIEGSNASRKYLLARDLCMPRPLAA